MLRPRCCASRCCALGGQPAKSDPPKLPEAPSSVVSSGESPKSNADQNKIAQSTEQPGQPAGPPGAAGRSKRKKKRKGKKTKKQQGGKIKTKNVAREVVDAVGN